MTPKNPLAAGSGAQNPLARPAADPWAGVFEGEGLRLELAREGDGWKGTITLGADRFPVLLRAQGPGLEGSFESQGHPYPCALAAREGGVSLDTAGTTYALRRQPLTGRPLGAAPTNPLAAPPPRNPLAGGAPAPAHAPAGAEVPADWQRFTHPTGVGMRYPAGWQLRELQGAMALVPPDLAMEFGQPAELMLVAGAGNQGVTGADDPRVAQYADATVQQLLPFLRREGGVTPLPGPPPGGVFTWAGQNPQGKQIRARMWVVLFPDTAVLLFAAAEPARLQQREPDLRRIAASFHKGEAQRDANLVGVWRHENHYFSGTFSSTTLRYLTLRPDGTAYSGGRLLASMSHRDSGGTETGHSLADTGDPDTKKGTWIAGSGRLFLQWADGSEEYKYELGGGSLLLTPDGGKPKLYERAN